MTWKKSLDSASLKSNQIITGCKCIIVCNAHVLVYITSEKQRLQRDFTRLSNLLATIEAKRLSPASSEMRKIYSGAVTWFERCVRPDKTHSHSISKMPLKHTQTSTDTHRTAGWRGRRSTAALRSCELVSCGSARVYPPVERCLN